MIKLTHQPVEPEMALKEVADDDAGAILLFLGTTRRWTGDTETTGLVYECYPAMAEKEMCKLRDEAITRWGLKGVCIVHRLGLVPVGETSLAIAVSSAHRVAAFEAGQWLIDTLKEMVPVWKQEIDEEGNGRWVHPDKEAAQ